MTPLLFCFVITCCIVYIWDYTSFIQQAADSIISTLTHNKIKHTELRKPFGCSLCMTQWSTLIFLLCVQPQYFWMSFVFSWSTQFILLTYNTIDRILLSIFKLLEYIF